jgi:hypothetical protein
MNILETHEIFEMEILEKLKNSRLLDAVVFGGGTMLRLCHDMKRYSMDLDFWRVKDIPATILLKKLNELLRRDYEITDSQIKHFSILVEIRSRNFPKRLKIEIRKEIRDWDIENKIAYSKYSAKQVLLKVHTLEQSMKNKTAALLSRREIRDAFDMEFLMRRGGGLPKLPAKKARDLISIIDGFTMRDFKVKLGSVLEADMRSYYVQNRFALLRQKLTAGPAGPGGPVDDLS